MDIRMNILKNVTDMLYGRVDESAINLFQDVLIIELNNYEVQDRCTEMVVCDTSAEKMLKKFLATKRIEGIAESTLRR